MRLPWRKMVSIRRLKLETGTSSSMFKGCSILIRRCCFSSAKKFWEGQLTPFLPGITLIAIWQAYLNRRVLLVLLDKWHYILRVILWFSNVVSSFSIECRSLHVRLRSWVSLVFGSIAFQLTPDPPNPCLTTFNLGNLLNKTLSTGAQIPFLGCSVLKFTLTE